MKDDTVLAGIAILCLTILEAIALIMGIDGVYFMPVVAAIAGIGGYKFKAFRNGK